jgi:hypothetical protein
MAEGAWQGGLFKANRLATTASRPWLHSLQSGAVCWRRGKLGVQESFSPPQLREAFSVQLSRGGTLCNIRLDTILSFNHELYRSSAFNLPYVEVRPTWTYFRYLSRRYRKHSFAFAI